MLRTRYNDNHYDDNSEVVGLSYCSYIEANIIIIQCYLFPHSLSNDMVGDDDNFAHFADE